MTTDIIDPSPPEPHSGPSSRDLVPAPRPSDLQIVLRTRDHAAYYDPSSNELSLQKRDPTRSLGSSESGPTSNDARLVRRPSETSAFHSIVKRFAGSRPLNNNAQEAICPTCARPWPISQEDPLQADAEHDLPSFTAPNYFRLLSQAVTIGTHPDSPNPDSNGFNTRPETPNFLPRNRFESASGTSTPLRSGASTPPEHIHHSSEAQGYYARFFVELKRLGRGARGQVFLCQHVLNGNKLGKFAIKKIPVGDHAQSLLQSLNEVHLMESLHHPHLIHYQHAWIERCQLSAFAPEVPTLFVLMMAANGGSLADWISARAGDATAAAGESGSSDSGRARGVDVPHPRNGKPGSSDGQKQGKKQDDVATVNPAERLRIERLKAALRQRRANRTAANDQASVPPRQVDPQSNMEVGVHLLREDEIYSLLTDITSGLAFLHDRGILHLDIKPGNVLLHWDEDSLIPRAMLSDFGSSLLLHDNWTRTRSGHTGTMEYMSPETILVNPITGRLDELSSKADIWSLGMILHLLLFFTLPFSQVEDVDALRSEMAAYTGFRRADAIGMGRRSDGVLLGLLERMLQVDPIKRPSCGDILKVLSAAKRESDQGDPRPPRRRQSKSGAHDGGQGVSLALYRPSALSFASSGPPSPTTPKQISAGTRSSSVPRILNAVPAEATSVAVALLKCLSPAIASRFFSLSRPAAAANVVWPSNPASMLILVLALIANAFQGPQSVHVRRACWFGHLLLLAWLTFPHAI